MHSMPTITVGHPASPSVAHQHDWRLLGVEYEDGYSVNRYECAGCHDCRFAA